MSAVDDAWARFLDYVRRARPELDGCVPVAMIFLPARSEADGSVLIDRDADGRILWPATFPIEDRGPLLAKLAKPYADGTVRR
jgi:hypothetical protein